MIASRSVNMVRHPRGSYIVIPIHCCLWSGHTRKRSNALALSSISKKVSTRPKSVLRAVLGRMQFTLHATHRTPHGASRLAASNVCLVGENPTCSVPAPEGSEGLWSYNYGHAQKRSTPPLPCRPTENRNAPEQ